MSLLELEILPERRSTTIQIRNRIKSGYILRALKLVREMRSPHNLVQINDRDETE